MPKLLIIFPRDTLSEINNLVACISIPLIKGYLSKNAAKPAPLPSNCLEVTPLSSFTSCVFSYVKAETILSNNAVSNLAPCIPSNCFKFALSPYKCLYIFWRFWLFFEYNCCWLSALLSTDKIALKSSGFIIEYPFKFSVWKIFDPPVFKAIVFSNFLELKDLWTRPSFPFTALCKEKRYAERFESTASPL